MAVLVDYIVSCVVGLCDDNICVYWIFHIPWLLETTELTQISFGHEG